MEDREEAVGSLIKLVRAVAGGSRAPLPAPRRDGLPAGEPLAARLQEQRGRRRARAKGHAPVFAAMQACIEARPQDIPRARGLHAIQPTHGAGGTLHAVLARGEAGTLAPP